MTASVDIYICIYAGIDIRVTPFVYIFFNFLGKKGNLSESTVFSLMLAYYLTTRGVY